MRATWAGDEIGKSTIPDSPIFWRWENDSSDNNYGVPSAKHDIQDWELLVITEGVPFLNNEGTSPVIDEMNTDFFFMLQILGIMVTKVMELLLYYELLGRILIILMVLGDLI